MADKASASSTIRIDLLKEGAPAAPPKAANPGGAASLLRMNLSMRHRLPPSVARSRYQELLQSVYDAAIITTITGTIVDANLRAVEFLQFEKSELCSLSIYEVIAGANASLMDTLSDNLARERFAVIQAYCVRRDGTTFPAEIAVNKLRLDDLCLCFFIRDITLRTQAEEMLRIEHMAIQNAGNGIVISDLDARLEYANPAFARMLGYEKTEELIGHDLRQWIEDPSLNDEAVRHLLESRENWKGEIKMKTAGGEEIFVQVSAACTRDAEGEAVGLVFSFADITEHRRTEEMLRLTQAQLEQVIAARTSPGQEHD